MRAGFRLGPRARMQPGFERNSQKFVPGRMKLDLVEAMTVAVERAQLRRGFIGVETELDGFGFTESGAQCGEFAMRPTGTLTRHRLTQNNVAREQIVGLERRRLVLDLEHGRVLRQGHCHCTSRIRGTARSAPAPSSPANPSPDSCSGLPDPKPP